MKNFLSIIFIYGCSLVVFSGDDSHKGVEKKLHKNAHWGYSGEEGPQYWGELCEAYILCKTGVNQSPINIITDKVTVKNLDGIEFTYSNNAIHFLNNGHTLQQNIGPNSYIKVGGRKYTLLQFHFHTPSENIVNGSAYDMEMHLVHKSEEGNLAVVGVFFQVGEHHTVLQKLLDNIPIKSGQVVKKEVQLNTKDLLPKNRSYYQFSGSLTTPPCSEGVTWLVMANPINISEKQLALFFKIMGTNARPSQPLNKRTVKLSK